MFAFKLLFAYRFTHSRRELIPPDMSKDDRVGTSLIRIEIG